MDKEVKVVIGANYGDEGKGLVSWCLAKNAYRNYRKILTVLFNGGAQRGHTTGNGNIVHGVGAGYEFGSDTYYHEKFMVDPIAIWLEHGSQNIYINPKCRVVLPCDVINNHLKELRRKDQRHGSCGMGIFEACLRNDISSTAMYAEELFAPLGSGTLFETLKRIENVYDRFDNDIVYNRTNFLRAVEYIRSRCYLAEFEDLMKDNEYDTVIFEGGQGLLLDQRNQENFPYLTPSCTGIKNIEEDILLFGVKPSIYYVSRSYMTRHGNGPMENECKAVDITTGTRNEEIVTDCTNLTNAWQGKLRYGYLNQMELIKRVGQDCSNVANQADINLVYTHLNYTDGKLVTGFKRFDEIVKPDFVTNVLGSDRKDQMDILL